MPFTLPHTALLTPAAVRDAQTGGEEVRLPEDEGRVGRIIASVTGEIERRLGRTLIVRPVSAVPEWSYDKARRTYRAWLPQWPAVGTVTDVTFDGMTAYSATYPEALDYFAGYRRDDQTLEGLQSEVDGLTALPDVLPYDITGFAVDAVLYRLNSRAAGVGIASTEIDTGQGIVRRTGVRATWWEENWPRIAHHRNPVL